MMPNGKDFSFLFFLLPENCNWNSMRAFFNQAHHSHVHVWCVTGRNIHALDPYRMPGQAALERGGAAGQGILQAHRDANNGAYPETVAVGQHQTCM